MTVSSPGTTVVDGFTVAFDEGSIDPVARPAVTRTFRLVNHNSDAVSIDYINSGCSCDSVQVTSGTGSRGLPCDLQPGATADVRVTVSVDNLKSGHFQRDIWIYVRGQAVPAAAKVRMRGTIRSHIEFEVPAIEAGRIAEGTGYRTTTRLTIDKRMLRAKTVPVLVSDNPEVRVENCHLMPLSPNEDALDFDISVSRGAPCGLIASQIAVDEASLNFSSAAIKPTSLQLPKLLLFGEVIGAAVCDPMSINFGALNHGVSGTEDLLIYMRTGKELRIIRLLSSSQAFAARQISVPPSNRGATNGKAFVRISCSPTKDGEVLRGFVYVSLSNGETLSIPVEAYSAAK